MYTLVRHYYGLPDYLDTYMNRIEDEDCFNFDTEDEAEECLKYFGDGEYFNDEKYGRIRYYIWKYKG